MLPHHTKITKYAFAVFILLAIGYAFYEARNMLYGPDVVLNVPQNGMTVEEELVEITGAATNVAEITMDGKPIFIDDSGAFSEKRLLNPGINSFMFEVKDKFGRVKTETLEIVYAPTASADTPQTDIMNEN